MGIPVAMGGADGALVTEPGQLQYGPMLLGVGTSAGWRELVGWRDHPDASVADSPRPQAHGTYAGAVYGESLVVTFTYLLRGSPEDKQTYLDLIEQHTRMDGVERQLTVNDGSGSWFRMARVIARHVPQDAHFRHGPVECSVQFLCADPLRYSLSVVTASLSLPSSVGGLEYPLTYPLDYGTFSAGSRSLTNEGAEATPVTLTFRGPLTNPKVSANTSWLLGFDINLADGESLVVDTAAGTALLNGTADRLYLITPSSDPVERCRLAPNHATDLSLTASAGSGTVDVSFHHARM